MVPPPRDATDARVKRRERALRTLTFWLRPDFVLRVLNRFQKVAGFDRAVALSSSALTAMIPLAIVLSAAAGHFGGKDAAERIIGRYELSGGGAEAVRDVFSPPVGTDTTLGIVGVLFLTLTALSFARAMQRLFEQTWDLKPLGMRNSLNGLAWVGALVVYLAIGAALHTQLGRDRLDLGPALLLSPFSAVFLIWSGWALSARRIAWRDLVPFGVTGAVLLALYSLGATVYVPHLFSTYATRYGVIGAVFAMISALFCLAVIVVGAAAAGREVHVELLAIRRDQRPDPDEVRRQWDEVIATARSRWQGGRRRIAHRSHDGERRQTRV